MTYTFKLARRLAVSRHFGVLTTLVLLAACAGDSTAPDTETSGFALGLYLGIAYQIDDHLQIRAGLGGNAFFGADKLEGRTSTLSSTATHIGLPIDLSYGF